VLYARLLNDYAKRLRRCFAVTDVSVVGSRVVVAMLVGSKVVASEVVGFKVVGSIVVGTVVGSTGKVFVLDIEKLQISSNLTSCVIIL
jgi:hypothetical protein